MTRIGPPRDREATANVRAEWFLRELGRFPTAEEVIAVREHERAAAADARLSR